MQEFLISIIKSIIGWTLIIFIIIKIKNYLKQIIIKEQLKNLDLQKNIQKRKLEYKKNYIINKNIFTETEKKFYKLLKIITDDINLNILAKVRLADIIHTENKNYKYFNKIKAKHIDFILIDKEGNIKLLIELDDKTHNNYDRQQRDKFINEIFINEKIKLLRIPVQNTYNLQEIKQKIQESL